MTIVVPRDIEQEVRALAADFSGRYTLALTNLTTGEHVGIDEDTLMATASVIKVPVLAAVYRAVEEGALSLDQRMTYTEAHKTIGSGVLSRLSFGVEMSLRDAAVLMIIISDNSATNMCIDAVGGVDYVNATMRRLGLEKTTLFTRLGDGRRGLDGRDHFVMTAREGCRLMELIARHQVVSSDASEDMLKIMRRQQHREKLARNLPWSELNVLPDPRNQWVASKGGTYLFGVRNDIAIMHGNKGEVAIAAFTEGGKGTETVHEGNDLLASIGQLVWESLCA